MPEISDQKFANAALDAGLVTPEMVKECLAIQKRQEQMGLMPKTLKELLVEKGYIADDVARKIARGEEAQEAKEKEKVVRIGGYEVVARLGKGQMGSVYKARQVSLDRIVALKVLPSRLAGDKRYLQRFLREAKAAGRLNHPNIVTAVEFGESNGLYYYAMDFVDGVNVGEILEEEGKLGEDEALAVALQIAKALEHAHENNIIHRDIKPENIMLDSEGRARLCDLGLAREAHEDGALTQAGIVLGTPYYISPEQAQGRRDLDTRSDIYSLGITLFHMVSNQIPFKGNTGPAIMVKHINENVPDVREINPGLSQGTAHLIKKMTSRNRDKRYQTPAELIKDIERVIAGERPAAAGPVIRARKRRRPGERREEIVVTTGAGNKLVPLVALVVVAVIIIVAISSLSKDKPAKRGTPGGGTGTGTVDYPGAGTGRTGGTGEQTAGQRQPGGGSHSRIPIEQREIKDIMDWARKNPKETAEIARRYGDFIETATDQKALKTATQALEGLATREFITLQRRFDSLFNTGNIDRAQKEVSTFRELFGNTKSVKKTMALMIKVKKKREENVEKVIAEANALAGEKKFPEALEMIAGIEESAPKEFKGRLKAAKAAVEKARKAHVAASRAKAEGTREEFEKNLAGKIAALYLDEAVRLITERVKIEVDSGRAGLLRNRAADLVEAKGALQLVMGNLRNLVGLKQTFNINRKGNEAGIIKEVKDTSFLFDTGKVAREVKINQLSAKDIVRLAELGLGPDEAKSRYRLGLLFLLVFQDPQEAGTQLAKAGELGMDTSRFKEKLAASRVEEMLDKAAAQERRKNYLDAAMTYSDLLAGMAKLEAYANRVKEMEQKIDFCLRESGAQGAFNGKVSIEGGRLIVTYDFENPAQWGDFEDYIWAKELKRAVEWTVEKGVLVGKGAEAILWKGVFSGDMTVEVDATPQEPASPAFFLRLCDDGKGWKGRNYSFGFGFKEKVLVGYTQKIVKGRRVREPKYQPGTPEILLMKWKGSSKKNFYLKRGIHFPQIKSGTTYKIKIQRTGQKLLATVNGTKIIETEDKDYKKGGLSLKVFKSVVHFDNLRITGDFDQAWLNRELRKARR
jgi:serine/threonine-protein kinase